MDGNELARRLCAMSGVANAALIAIAGYYQYEDGDYSRQARSTIN